MNCDIDFKNLFRPFKYDLFYSKTTKQKYFIILN